MYFSAFVDVMLLLKVDSKVFGGVSDLGLNLLRQSSKKVAGGTNI